MTKAPKQKTQIVALNLRIPFELHAAVSRLAKENFRSLTGEILVAISDRLERNRHSTESGK